MASKSNDKSKSKYQSRFFGSAPPTAATKTCRRGPRFASFRMTDFVGIGGEYNDKNKCRGKDSRKSLATEG